MERCECQKINVPTIGLDSNGAPIIVEALVLCQQCRADLDLGRLVRAMPLGSELYHKEEEKYRGLVKKWRFYDFTRNGPSGQGDTPEAALRKAKGEGK